MHVGLGRLVIDGEYTDDADGRDGWALTHVGDRTWRDYTFEAKYDSRNKAGYPRGTHMVLLLAVEGAGPPQALDDQRPSRPPSRPRCGEGLEGRFGRSGQGQK